LIATLGADPEPAPSDAPPTPDTIFANARAAWTAGSYPRYADYVAVVRFHNHAKLVRRTWETTEDIRTGYLYSKAFSREELASPTTPHGINVSIPFLGNLNKEHHDDPIGQVAFAIDQDYGIAPGQRHYTATSDVTVLDAQSSALAHIGRTGTIAREYDVRLIDSDDDAYHLGLTPVRDPGRHRLRELWVERRTWLPQAAIVTGISSRAPLSRVPWRVEFRRQDDASYIARESALAPIDFFGDTVLPDVTISFEEVKLGWRRPLFSLGFSKSVPLSEP
jgi:hypothetical protein